jgi:hypothetical protein
MACAKCGQAITNKFERRTVGIATELDFRCLSCKSFATANALRSNYVLEQLVKEDFIQKGSRIDSYKLNWRLILETQLIGESQVGGSIIGLMLDISRDTF